MEDALQFIDSVLGQIISLMTNGLDAIITLSEKLLEQVGYISQLLYAINNGTDYSGVPLLEIMSNFKYLIGPELYYILLISALIGAGMTLWKLWKIVINILTNQSSGIQANLKGFTGKAGTFLKTLFK